MTYIVLIAREHDYCCELVARNLSARGRAILRLHEADLFPHLEFGWELNGGRTWGEIGFAGQSVEFRSIDAVLARFWGVAVRAESFPTKDGQYISAEWHALAQGWLHSLSCPVVNLLRPELWYKPRLSVPALRSLVPCLKFKTPRVTIATRVADARAVYDSTAAGVRYSPLSQRSEYGIRTEESFAKLTNLRGVLPFCLTEVLEGENITAFVVGTSVVWVSADGRLNETMPVDVEGHCAEIAMTLGLRFCVIDITRTSAGEWYCRGLDCLPDVHWCSDEAALAVASRLGGLLMGENSASFAAVERR